MIVAKKQKEYPLIEFNQPIKQINQISINNLKNNNIFIWKINSIMYEFKDAVKDTVLLKAEFVPVNIKKIRLEICVGCPKFKKLSRTCSDCGCQMDLKVMYGKSECPDGKW